mmetsp:Transcript_21603/g.43493  ORF Transcript_21603/g.43493 Transcript_21603/m.43493 type:complete len:214 (-) Transcript_21603:101-742(-)
MVWSAAGRYRREMEAGQQHRHRRHPRSPHHLSFHFHPQSHLRRGKPAMAMRRRRRRTPDDGGAGDRNGHVAQVSIAPHAAVLTLDGSGHTVRHGLHRFEATQQHPSGRNSNQRRHSSSSSPPSSSSSPPTSAVWWRRCRSAAHEPTTAARTRRPDCCFAAGPRRAIPVGGGGILDFCSIFFLDSSQGGQRPRLISHLAELVCGEIGARGRDQP